MTTNRHRRTGAAAAPRFALLVVLLAAAPACARSTSASSGGGGGGSASSSSSRPPTQWSATLEAVGGSGVGGSALITPGGSSSETSVTLMVNGAPPNGTLPWHFHTGRCGEAGGAIVGQAQAYTPIPVGADGGSAQHRVTLPFTVPATGDLRIQVHRSSSDMGTIVACGNLAPM